LVGRSGDDDTIAWQAERIAAATRQLEGDASAQVDVLLGCATLVR
jgi:hypothetical protein